MGLVLRELQYTDELAFGEAVTEFARTDPDWEFAFGYRPDGDFRSYVERLTRQQRGLDLPEGWVPSTYLVGVVGKQIVGRVSLRLKLNDFLREIGGHVGYGVVASQRRKGYATEMLAQTLPIARGHGIDRLLVTCDDDNMGSRRTIERNGGVFEDTRPHQSAGTLKRRYWVDTHRAR